MEPIIYPPPSATYVLGIDPIRGLYLIPVVLGADLREFPETSVWLLGHRPGDEGPRSMR